MPDYRKQTDFKEVYGRDCSLLMSSSSTPEEPHIWLGVNEVPKMLLTREMVAKLVPALRHFMETGVLPDPK
jgi:hypothetical protein